MKIQLKYYPITVSFVCHVQLAHLCSVAAKNKTNTFDFSSNSVNIVKALSAPQTQTIAFTAAGAKVNNHDRIQQRQQITPFMCQIGDSR